MEWYFKAPSEAPMSATDFRAALDTGKGLQAFLPTSVDPQKVLAVLGVEPEPEAEEPEIGKIDEPEDSGAPPAIFMGEDLMRMIKGVMNEQGKESMAPVKKRPKPRLDTSSVPEWWPHQQKKPEEIEDGTSAETDSWVKPAKGSDQYGLDTIKHFWGKDFGSSDYSEDEEIEIVDDEGGDDKELGIIRGDIWELAAQMGMPDPSDSLASEMDISKLEDMRTVLEKNFYDQQEHAYEFVNQGLANLGIDPDVVDKVCPGGSLDCLNGFGSAMSDNPEEGDFEGFSWENQERDEEGLGVGDTGEYADYLGDTGDTGLDEASSMAGGNVAGFAGPGRGGDEKSLIREEEPIIEEVLNYLLGRMEIL